MDAHIKARKGFRGNCLRSAYVLPVLFAVVIPLAACRSVRANVDYDRNELDQIVNVLKKQYGIASPVQVEVIPHNTLGFSVEPTGTGKFVLLVDANFVRLLDDEELTAALAHELAHVWIYTHHPFLHTEPLANRIAMQVVPRDSLKDLYVKVWTFYGDRGTIEELLGPERSLSVSNSEQFYGRAKKYSLAVAHE
jgi:hypothetical protein